MNFEKCLAHPNPQMMREHVIDLCGEWDFSWDSDNIGIKEKWFLNHKYEQKIIVPFVYQSSCSGIGKKQNCNIVWYQKVLKLDISERKKYLLHFEASDYITTVWVNGIFVTEHQGGFTPFVADITHAVSDSENTISVRVEDTTSPTQLLGKQSWKDENFLCWYTRSTGIWQPIWLEIVPEIYIKTIYITPNIDKNQVAVELQLNHEVSEGYIKIAVALNGKEINQVMLKVYYGNVKAFLEVYSHESNFQVEYWSPKSPVLYDLKLCYVDEKKDIRDEIYSYFGMRKIATFNNRILLNNCNFYQKLVLNQGYYGKGLMTPQSTGQLVSDIKKIKDCGFNGMRIHQTIATNTLLYLCDVFGLVVWGEMPSFYKFNQSMNLQYFEELKEAIEKQYNHPCIITWVLFNESWGINCIYNDKKQQNFVSAAYHYAKALDSTRLCIGNDGWEHTETDILTIHDYTQEGEKIIDRFAMLEQNEEGFFSDTSQRSNFAKGYIRKGLPIIISELGGIAYGSGHDSWGYGKRLTTKKDCFERIANLINSVAKLDSICGYCYTQWSDVEQEVNGILDAEHNAKYNVEEIEKINREAKFSGYIFD